MAGAGLEFGSTFPSFFSGLQNSFHTETDSSAEELGKPQQQPNFNKQEAHELVLDDTRGREAGMGGGIVKYKQFWSSGEAI